MSATPDSTLANPEQLIADLQRQLAEREAELAECQAERDAALEREAATAEILQVINSSPGDLAPVFDAMLDKATHLCEASYRMLYRYDGDLFRAVALHAVPSAYADFLREPFRADSRNALGRLVGGERLVHMPNLREDAAYLSGEPLRMATVELGGARTYLGVPLRKDGVLLGAIGVYRQEVRPFSEKQITLLENFAAQAVIAMENARLLIETREALEQQQAIAEVLQVINSSPGDLAPVFDAMLGRATRVCGAAGGTFWSYDRHGFQVLAATIGDIGRTMLPDPGTSLWRIAKGENVVQIADIETEQAYGAATDSHARTRLAGTRTALAVALRKDETLIGAITTGRQEVRPFSEKQIALLQNFAAQAVIAMENARLLVQ
jgi:GAF domain-containing protein